MMMMMKLVATTAAPTAATNAVKATATNSSAAASATRTLLLLIIYEFDDDNDDDVPLDESMSLDDAATCSSCWACFGSLLDNDTFPSIMPLSWSLFTSLSLSIRFANPLFNE